MGDDKNIFWHSSGVTPADREKLLGQKGCVLWLTGLSGSGKSTIARALEARLVAGGHAAFTLDGDNLRHGINAKLGFSPEDRAENLRRAAEVAKLFADAGMLAIVSFISPYAAARDKAREIVGAERFLEIFVDAPLEICERRDPKGLYAKARAGQIADFTGVNAPYERPESPAAIIDTGAASLEDAVRALLDLLAARGFTPLITEGTPS